MSDNITANLASNIQQLTPAEFWVGIVIVSAISLASFFQVTRRLHQARLIENVPTAKVRSAPQGYVELIGQTKLMDGPVIVSPLTSRTCVWYSYKIEEKVTRHQANGKWQSHWKCVEQKRSEDLFLLEDETGRCVIDPDGAEVIPSNKKVWHKHHVIPPRRYTEEIIREREDLYAIGLFKTDGEIDNRRFQERVAHLLRHWKNDPNQLLHLYDANRDQELNASEWENARQMAEAQVTRDLGSQQKLQQLNILCRSPHKDQSFILSTIAETELVKRYRKHAFGALILFLATGSMVVWALNVRLGL